MNQNVATDICIGPDKNENTTVKRASVGDLMRLRNSPTDYWKLALVQRHEVWDEVRIKRLLDSLFAGYPIGTLLVCQVVQKSKVLDDARKAIDPAQGTWQLLDGQQRINALVCIFTDQGHLGRFMVDMFAPRHLEEIATRRRAKREVTEYIKNLDGLEAGEEEFSERGENRERYLDLSRWYKWTEGIGENGVQERLNNIKDSSHNPQACIKILNEIDPAFADTIVDTISLGLVAEKTRRLLEIWVQKRIPVQYVTLDSPGDVLQVFVRANLEGVRLDGEDVFFAGVKTLWNDAEENLERVSRATTLINRMTALRLLARLASRGISTEDLQPLRIDRLNPPKGKRIITAMQHLAQDGSEVLARIGMLGELLTAESRLGYALREVNTMLFDHIFGWAAVNSRASDRGYLKSHLQMIETYLLGATAFRYPMVFLDTFARLGFDHALEAGRKGDPFPLEGIAKACHEKWRELKRGRGSVPKDGSDEDHLKLAKSNYALFLSIVHRIPYVLPLRDAEGGQGARREVEWDHIYAQALAKKMRVFNEQKGRLEHHKYIDLIWSAGNLWALDRPLNTSAQDLPPSKKFKLLDEAGRNGLRTRWPYSEDAFLIERDRYLLLETEKLMAVNKVEEAMLAFREFAEGRGLRLYNEIIKGYPEMKLFAPTSPEAPVDYEPPEPHIYRAELGLDDADIESPQGEEELPGDSKFKSVFDYSAERGTEHELRMIIDAVREIGLYARPHRRSVMITPPKIRTRMLFTIRPQRADGGSFAIFRSSAAIEELFTRITQERALTLGKDGWGTLRLDEVPAFIGRLRQLFLTSD